MLEMKSDETLIAEFQKIEERFNAAMVSNDPDTIAKCITEDWALVNPESGPINREIILGIIGNGALSHSSMTKEVKRVEQYGEMAVVTARGQNTGTFQGNPIEADEWITDIYIRKGGDWLCVLTHLTPAAA